MGAIQELSAGEGARIVLLALLDASSKAARRLRTRSDDEALHDFRTSLRRMRSTLKAYRGVFGRRARRFARELGEIAAWTNRARDAEVHLEWVSAQAAFSGKAANPATAVQERLERQRRRGHDATRDKAVPAFRTLATEMGRWLRSEKARARGGAAPAQSFGRYTAAVIRELSSDLLSHLDEVASVRDEVALHQARIRGKRLRYVLEPLEGEHGAVPELLVQLKALQEVLGDIHDRQMIARVLEHTSSGRGKQGGRVGRTAPLRARANAELRERFGDLQRRWLGGGARDLDRRVEALATELESHGAPRSAEDTEIERKFLLKYLPREARSAPAQEISQGWIPGQRLQERLRRVRESGKEEFFRTVKLGRGIQRIEVEESTPPALFDRMWPLTEGRRVLKRRYAVEDGGRTWEIDEFLDRSLFLAEVELPTADAEVSIPRWLAPAVEREVTGEDAFVNVNLAR